MKPKGEKGFRFSSTSLYISSVLIESIRRTFASSVPIPSTPSSSATVPSSTPKKIESPTTPEIVVAGGIAVDFSCDYAPFTNATASSVNPALHTSNPAMINQTVGGVAHNIAKAAHFLGSSVELHSAVGKDLSGRAVLDQLAKQGVSTAGIQMLDHPSRTAQYVAVNNAQKDLTLAMADMAIFEDFPGVYLEEMLSKTSWAEPKLLILDANWNSEAIHQCISNVKDTTTVIFEPVSEAKALRILPSKPAQGPIADIITPNQYELKALHDHAYKTGLFESPAWFDTIDALGIPSSGLRVPLTFTTNPSIVDSGVPQQAIKLLPFFPTVLTKLGSEGVLLTQVIKPNDPILSSPEQAQYVLARNLTGHGKVGGLYVRLFAPERVLRDEEVVSVNGIGDTFVGALAAGLAKGKQVRDVVEFAQKASVLSLKSKESVSPDLEKLRVELERL